MGRFAGDGLGRRVDVFEGVVEFRWAQGDDRLARRRGAIVRIGMDRDRRRQADGQARDSTPMAVRSRQSL